MKKISFKIKLLIAIAAFLVIIVASLILARMIISSKNTDNTTYRVKLETYENVIEIAGTIKAAQEQTLQAKSDGTVLGVFVKKGDKVKKGDLIIQLDAQEQEYNLAKLDYDMASTKISGSKRELELQEKQRLSILQKIDDRKVTATFDGIIADFDVNVGDSMEAKDSAGTLVNVDYLTAEVEIPETDVKNLKPNQKVIFTFPAYDGDVEGYVVSWPAIGEVTSRGATVVNTKIRIDNYPEQILPNYSFTGKIQITDPEEYLIVENYAIGRENRQAFVEKTNGEKLSVKVIPYGNGFVRIVEGNLNEGDELKQQSAPKISGMNRNKNNGKNSPGMMGGGPPPMR